MRSVGEQLEGTRRKTRVTVYYMLADHFGELDLFKRRAKAIEAATRAGVRR